MSSGEWFQFLVHGWDVEKAKTFVPDEVEDTIDPREVESMVNSILGVSVDEEYAMSDAVDLTEPVIIGWFDVEDDDGELIRQHLVIDGWHRVYRALEEGVETLPAYMLTPEEHAEVFEDGRPPDQVGPFLEWVEDEHDGFDEVCWQDALAAVPTSPGRGSSLLDLEAELEDVMHACKEIRERIDEYVREEGLRR